MVVGLFAVTTAHAFAQQACDFVEPGNDLLVQRPPFTYVTNPHMICEGPVEIWADSAVVNRDQSMSLLLGAVRYVDGMRELNAQEARYFYEIGRLQAQGSVVVTNHEDGSTVEQGDLVYLRQTEYREIEEMTFRTGADGLRPRATVYPRRPEPEADEPEPPADTAQTSQDVPPFDSTAVVAPDAPTEPDATSDPTAVPAPEPEEPPDSVPPELEEPPEPLEYIIVADSLFFRGDSYFDAHGTVEIVRDSLYAYADVATYDGDVGELLLDGSARVEGEAYDLVGRTITLASAADGSDEVRAVRDAVLNGEDLRVTAPRIVLHLLEGELERMVAVPLAPEADPGPASPPRTGAAAATDSTTADSAAAPRRPFAVSEELELTGDSLDLSAPGGTLERIFAAGSARSVSSGRADLNVETLPELARRDWIEADTIEVFLLPAPATADSTATDEEGEAYEVDRIVARTSARSLYRLVPADSAAVPGVDPPAVSYMVADQITIFMLDGQADRVESIGQVSGWHLEPLTPSQAADSASASPAAPEADSAPAGAVPPDAANDDGGDASPPGAYFQLGAGTEPWRRN